MKLKIKLLLIVSITLFGLSSCLDKYPENAIAEDKAINNVSDVEQAVIGIYSGFKSGNLYSGKMILASELQTDLCQAVIGNTNTYGNFWRWEIKPDSPEIADIYADLNTIIGRCNFVLDYEARVRSNTVDDAQLDLLDEYLGDVYFARALAYSELIKYFCKAYDPATASQTLGVVLVQSYKDPQIKKRASLKDSYQFVLDDLKRAEDLIVEETVLGGTGYDFFTKSAVNSLYARIYLYMQQWGKAIEYSTKVIEDPALALASTTQLATNTQSWYQYMWFNDRSPEVIWRINFTTTSYGGALGYPFLHYDYVSVKPDFVPADWSLNLYSQTDLRYNAFFQTLTSGYSHRLECPMLVKFIGNDQFIAQRIRDVSMPKVFRLSEQYLIRAEAYCNLAQYAKATTDLEFMRSKRINGANSYAVSADNWLNKISDERVRELYMEGFRLHDLKRWGRGFERTAQSQTVDGFNKLKVLSTNKLFVWPIPQHELNVPGTQVEPNESN